MKFEDEEKLLRIRFDPLQGLPKSVRVNTVGTIMYIGLNIGFFTVFFIVAISEFQKPASEYMNKNLM